MIDADRFVLYLLLQNFVPFFIALYYLNCIRLPFVYSTKHYNEPFQTSAVCYLKSCVILWVVWLSCHNKPHSTIICLSTNQFQPDLIGTYINMIKLYNAVHHQRWRVFDAIGWLIICITKYCNLPITTKNVIIIILIFVFSMK